LILSSSAGGSGSGRSAGRRHTLPRSE
jgi:hypothetical protein